MDSEHGIGGFIGGGRRFGFLFAAGGAQGLGEEGEQLLGLLRYLIAPGFLERLQAFAVMGAAVAAGGGAVPASHALSNAPIINPQASASCSSVMVRSVVNQPYK